MSDFSISTRLTNGGEVTSNGRVYPPDVMMRAFQQAEREGKLKVEDRREDGSAGGPMELGGRRFVKPKFTAKGFRQADDGSIYMDVHVDDQATAVDRLADIVNDDE